MACEVSLEGALKTPSQAPTAASAERRRRLYASFLPEAHALAEQLEESSAVQLPGELAELQFFAL